MKDEYKEFSHNLMVYMEYNGITKTELSKKVGVAPSTVTGWIQGERYPRLGVMLKLLALFDCTQDDLMSGYKSSEQIRQDHTAKRLLAYYERLNPDGVQKVLEYMEDLNGKYYKENEDVQ